MFEAIKALFAQGPQINFEELLKKGAQIIDVRTPGEFQGGHIKGSVNIPLDTLQRQLGKIKKDKPVITCCASGMRSGSASGILQSSGYKEVYNGGGWTSLQQKISR
ncbi:MAG: rhodanese-like domain-containing protein [Chitinophagaceae bacterium]|nr:rhodanese-like domain-containing protein [Chitinophagaceae bacterium]MDP1764696.1 rhodanese-like domain-containing protein [Sediminibacterium sp.]MDP3665145.1 rhodanese-like domain-containing protein [Sediminibacterium sp.]